MSTVRFEQINKYYGNTHVLKDINLEVCDGEFLVLVGPSGCGKSTTLRLVAGLEDPSEGNLYIDDRIVNDIEPPRRDIAMVFQNYALYPHMNVFENMSFGLKIRKLSSDEISKRVKEAADILQIGDLLSRRPKELSGGQRQRVALRRCIVRKPKVFLFDEPLSNLDAKLRAEMRIEIKKLHQILKTTKMYVTHDQTEAMTMGSRIAVINQGVIEQLETPANIYKKPVNRYVAGFIGSPKMNFIMGNLKRDEQQVSFAHENIIVPLKKQNFDSIKKEVILGIRPENISIEDFGGERTGRIRAEVDLIEPLGSVNLLHLNSGNIKFSASVPASKEISEKDQIIVNFDNNYIHFFDIDTHRTIN